MSSSYKYLKLRRRFLDQRIREFFPKRAIFQPKEGWVRAVRESLGMSTVQLALRLGITQPSLSNLEQRETTGKVTLEILDQAARALQCRLVYAIIPEKSLEDLVEQEAKKIAMKILSEVSHTMFLEQQETENAELKAQFEELVTELKDGKPSILWEKNK